MTKYNNDGEEIIGEGSEIIKVSNQEPDRDSLTYTFLKQNKRLESELPDFLRHRVLKDKPRYDPPNRTDFSEEGTRLLEEWRELQRRKQQEQHDAIARRTLIESEHWKIEAEKNRLEKEKREYNEKYGAWL